MGKEERVDIGWINMQMNVTTNPYCKATCYHKKICKTEKRKNYNKGTRNKIRNIACQRNVNLSKTSATIFREVGKGY